MTLQEWTQPLLKWIRKHAALRDVAFQIQNVIASVSPSHVRARAKSQHASYFVSALVRVKDEARFLPEWVVYHHLLGVQHFYIYDNGSSDGTTATLQPLVDRGLVTLIDWPSRPISPAAERHFLRTFARDSQWVAFLDADEYLTERSPGALRDLLVDSSRWPAVALNWRYFGSSFFEVVPAGLIYENFTRADAVVNRHIKVIAQSNELHRTRNSHNFYYRRGRLARTPTGAKVRASFADPRWADDAPAAINHYVYRSRADAMRKVDRGFVDRQGEIDAARRRSQVAADFFLHNEMEIPPDDTLVARIQGLLSDLGYAPELIGPS